MNSSQAPISKILPWSCVDGPGNRMVLFLQGCNFNCTACHNPHTIGVCDHCGECISACPEGALTLVEGQIKFDAAVCTSCDACLEVCPINANPMVQTHSVQDILRRLREHAAFLSGLTVSGGEPTMHLHFIHTLFSAIGDDPDLKHLTRFIDTNGYLGPKGWNSILDVTDGVMLDIKAFDPTLHVRLTGRDNKRSLASARLLHEARKLYELRYLIVAGQTGGATELNRLRDFVKSLKGPLRIRLNAFRPHGVRGDAAQWAATSREQVEFAAQTLTDAGIGPLNMPSCW